MIIKALVVDDSGIMRKMVMRSLTESKLVDFEFVEAEDGQIALEKIKSTDIDIAFVDWNMPNMSGIDFVKHVRSHEKKEGTTKTPLVMVTSEKSFAKTNEALDEAEADGFISKPFTVEDLQIKLKKHTDQAQKNRIKKDWANAKPAAAPATLTKSGLLRGFFG